MRLRPFWLLLLTGLLVNGLRAQDDSLADMRLFLKVCNDYKRLPVQLDVDLSRGTNLVTSKTDTERASLRFVLCAEGSYMRMEGLEQLANDSLLLLVNPTTRRMVLFSNHESVADRMREYLDMQLRDSSVTQLVSRYKVKARHSGKDTAELALATRRTLYATALPREEIRIRYNPATDRPYEVRELTRSLVPVSDSVYRMAAHRPEWAGLSVADTDSSFYLVRERRQTFFYRKMDHAAGLGLPVRLSDRIMAEPPGKYRPVKEYANYVLTQQF